MVELIHVVLHIDQYLATWSQAMGPWIYVLMFLIIFAETGLIVTPFLPGDSLLFALGALTTMESGLDVWTLSILLMIAAIIGDNLNYRIGMYIGPKVFTKKDSKIFNQDHLRKTQEFYEKYGGKAVVLARFVPIVRTFVPFVAGVGQMNRKSFLIYNIVGAVLWINIFLFAGHFFGNLPVIKRNFHIVIVAVILVSVLPIVVEFVRHRWLKKTV